MPASLHCSHLLVARPLVGFLAALVLLFGATRSGLAEVGDYEYLCPFPDSKLIRTKNNVIIRFGEPIEVSTLTPGVLTVVGDGSGSHSGALELSDDGETIVFTPATQYLAGERVVVTLSAGIKTVADEDLPPFSYDFYVTPQVINAPAPRIDPLSEYLPDLRYEAPPALFPARTQVTPCDLPAEFPEITLFETNQPAPGYVFLGPFGASNIAICHLLILDELANPIFWRIVNRSLLDFKQTIDGRIGYFQPPYVYLLDASYAAVDSFSLGNGYSMDAHDFQLLPDGHMLLMSYDRQPVRMDTVVVGGRSDAVVIGFVVQELDLARRVVFQWRSWDEIPVTDVASSSVSLTDSLIDYIHGNAMELDSDGNLLVSSRHLNEITKISRQTGRILWRFGRNALQNQFMIHGDPRGFSHQHDIRRLPNGNISLFDNGNELSPEYSRALEYDLNEMAHQATLVSEYRTTPDTYGPFMGNVQLLPNGGHMIGWGGSSSGPRLTELDVVDGVQFELTLPPSTWTYRAYKFPWSTTLMVPSQSTLDFGVVDIDGDPVTLSVFLSNHSQRSFTFNCIKSTHPGFTTDHVLPYTLASGDSTELEITFSPIAIGEFDERFYVRSVGESEIISTVIKVRARTNPITTVGERAPLAFGLHPPEPNPSHSGTLLRFDLPRPVPVTLQVFDVHGRRVATLLDGMKPAGRHEVRWEAPPLADGVYLCRLRAGGFDFTRKIVRVK